MKMRSLRAALAFLTTLPVATADLAAGDFARASAWFGAVGLVLGGLLAGGGGVVGALWPPEVGAALLLALWVGLTGGLHLDGWVDCCDALFASVPPARRLVILKDVHVGAFGVVGAGVLLLLKWAALLALLRGEAPLAALLLPPVVGRVVIVAAQRGWPYARAEGLGQLFPAARWAWVGAGLALLLAALPLGGRGAVAAGLALAGALGAAAWMARRLGGGLTGDCYGALCELAEVLALLALLALNGQERPVRLPHRLPFRLGATSYVIPAGLVANALALRGVADDMQLVLFDSPTHGSNIPDAATVARLADVAGAALTYSLHLPTHLHLAASDPHERAHAIEQALALLDRCVPLPLSGVVLHLEGDEPPDDDAAAWEAWRGRALPSLRALHAACPVPLCVENIERYPIERALPVVAAVGTALCLDVGHCWKVGRDPLPLLSAHLARAPLMHLHGWDGQRDHQHLGVLAPGLLPPVLSALRAAGWGGILTLEVFEADFWQARAQLLQAWDML